MPKAHARLSPSSSDRWLNCPGSVAANARAARTSNEYADEGTAAHELLECCLRLGVEPDVFLGTTFNGTHPATQEMCDAVGQALDWIASYTTANPKAEVHVEQEVKVGEAFARLDCWGTSDLIVETPDEIVVADYKHGAGVPVESDGNTQLLLYLLGHRHSAGKRKKYRTVIIQPRARHDAGPVRETPYTDKQLDEFAARAGAGARKTDDPRAERVPGDYCRWCAAAKVCKPLAEANLRAASAEFGEVVDPPDANELTREDLGYILTHQARIETWLKALAGYATELLRGGEKVPGFKLVQGRTTRAWNEEPAVMTQIVVQATGKPLDEVAPRELLSVAQLEKLLKKKGFQPFERYVEKKRGEAHLAPESDPRPSVRGGHEFADQDIQDTLG